MINFFYYIIKLVISFGGGIDQIAYKNQLKTDFEQYYNNKQWDKALKVYQIFNTISAQCDEKMSFNASNIYWQKGDIANAEAVIKKCSQNTSINTETIRLNHLAMIAAYKKDTLSALNILKTAIEQNIDNKFVIHNYELLKKKFKNKGGGNTNRNNNSEQETPPQGGTVQTSDDKKDLLDTTTPPLISREQALSLLEALKTNEKQIQFKKSKKSASEYYGEW